MKQRGIVIKTDENSAEVSVKRKSACGENCANCSGMCTAPVISIKAVNSIGAKAGDVVVIESKTSAILKCAFFLYIVPVVLMIVAYITAKALKLSDLIAAVCSLLLLVLSIAALKPAEKKLVPKTYITEFSTEEI